MDLRKIKKLIELLEASSLYEMEITEGEDCIRLSRGQSAPIAMSAPMVNPAMEMAAPVSSAPVSVVDESSKLATMGQAIKSPMVGTFYSAASTNATPYVKVGSQIEIGDTLCIIEAMKTFNQIQAEISGTVVEILKSSGEAVEFDELLFLVE